MSEDEENKLIYYTKKALFDLINKMLNVEIKSSLVIEIDFSKLPKKYLISNPYPINFVKEKSMIEINIGDFLTNVMPGLWGYANNQEILEKNIYICPHCKAICNCYREIKGAGDE